MMKIQHGKRWFFALAGVVLTLSVAIPPAQTQSNTPDYAKQEQLAPPAIRQRLTALRQRIKERNLAYQVGYTEPLRHSAKSMTGGRLPTNLLQLAKKQNTVARQVVRLDRETRDQALKANPQLRNKMPELGIQCAAGAKSFDWRKLGKVTPVKRQGCGSCWAYGAMATLESSYLIRNNLKADGSEQFIVTNSGAGSCSGGGTPGAIAFLATSGTTTEANLPDSGTDGTPNADDFTTPYQALTYGFVSDTALIPSTAEIKAALCEHGPVVSWVGVTDSFMCYTGGAYKDDDYATQKKKACPETGPPNGAVCGHYVTIIGWDDAKNSWLIKNSWGSSLWGETGGSGTERGYMWIDYGTNEIGAGSMWVEARSQAYRLPPRYYELVPQKRIDSPSAKKGIILQKN